MDKGSDSGLQGSTFVRSSKASFDIRRLMGLAIYEWQMLLIGAMFLAISSAALLAFPQVIKLIVDDALAAKDAATLNHVAMIALALFAVQSLAGAARYYCFTIAGERIVVRLRQQLFDHLLNQDISFFDNQKTGELQSRLSADTTLLQNAVSVNISMLVRTAASAFGGLGMLIYTSPALSAALLLTLPPVAAGVAVFGQRIRQFAKLQQDATAASGGVASETLGGIRIVRAFGQEILESKRYSDQITRSFGLAKRKTLTVAFFIGIASLLGLSGIVGVLWYGSLQVVNGTFTVGSLTSFMLYTLTVAVSVGTLGGLWTDFMAAAGASHRIFEIFDRPSGETKRGDQKLLKPEGRISFEQVSFHYATRADFPVLTEINFTIEPGEAVAVVGPSGGGKSTIAALISRFYDPTSGRICIDSRDLRSLKYDEYHGILGMVPQDPVLFSVSIEENIRFGFPGATIEAVKSAAALANASSFIEQFPDQYQTLVGERGIQLSGGQRQRIAIARAAVRNPRILILDEATSALDSESESLVQAALEKLMKERTTLVIAHRLSTVRNASKIIVVDHGKIVQIGTHAALIGDLKGLYCRLVERQLADSPKGLL